MELSNMKALKLDSTYRPIEVIDALDALVMCLVGKAMSLETHQRRVCSPSRSFELPAVIVLKTVVKFRFTGISCNRINIIARDKNRCQYCTKCFPTEELTMDHILPKSRGGKNTWTNLVASCRKCNQRKGARTPSEAHMYPISTPIKPKNSILRTLVPTQISDIWKEYLWE